MIDPAARRLALARETRLKLLDTIRTGHSGGGSYFYFDGDCDSVILAALDQYGDALARAIREEERAKQDQIIELERRAYDRLRLCPDHRDKANGRCVVCVAEERTRQEAAAIRALRGASRTEGEL